MRKGSVVRQTRRSGTREADPIQVADKLVTLESRFGPFHLSVKFPLKAMIYKGELAL
jgi:hypothetical protein